MKKCGKFKITIEMRLNLIRLLSTDGRGVRKPTEMKSKIIGLGENVFKLNVKPVGPGADKKAAYKNPEYFCYNSYSFYEAEIEMAKFRLEQPSAKTA